MPVGQCLFIMRSYQKQQTNSWYYLEPFNTLLFKNLLACHFFIIAAHKRARFRKNIRISQGEIRISTTGINSPSSRKLLSRSLPKLQLKLKEGYLLPFQNLCCKKAKSVYEFKEWSASRVASTTNSDCL